MATSIGKTIGLILLVIIILAFVLNVTPLIITPFGFFSGALQSLRMPKIESMHFGPSFFRLSTYSFFSLLLFIIWIMVIIWVYRDAERRGMNGILWALLVFIGNIIGLLIYLIVRSDSAEEEEPEQATHTCPSCEKPVDSNFVFCPYCAARLHAVCPECGKPTEKNWKACPHCGKKL